MPEPAAGGHSTAAENAAAAPASGASLPGAADVGESVHRAVLRTVLLGVVQDLAAHHGALAATIAAAPLPAASEQHVQQIHDLAELLRAARRHAVAAGITDTEVQTAYERGRDGIFSTRHPDEIPEAAAARIAALTDERDHARITAASERQHRIETETENGALRSQLAATHAIQGTDIAALFRSWQASTEPAIAQHFSAPPVEERAPLAEERDLGVREEPAAGAVSYTARIEVRDPGSTTPVVFQPAHDLSSEAETAAWVRTRLSEIDCALDAAVHVTADVVHSGHTAPVFTYTGQPVMVSEGVENWHHRVTDPQHHTLDTVWPPTAPLAAEPTTQPAPAPAPGPRSDKGVIGEVMGATFDSGSPRWTAESGVVAPADPPGPGTEIGDTGAGGW